MSNEQLERFPIRQRMEWLEADASAPRPAPADLDDEIPF
jgi:hypothetical protein